MDEQLRSLERRVEEGDIDALCSLVIKSVESGRNLYEYLPEFVKNRDNPKLRNVLNAYELIGLRHYGRVELLEADNYILPTGNLLAFNHLMNETPSLVRSFLLAEKVKTITKQKWQLKKGNRQRIRIDTRFGPADELSQKEADLIFAFLFGNLAEVYPTATRTLKTAPHMLVGREYGRVCTDSNECFLVLSHTPLQASAALIHNITMARATTPQQHYPRYGILGVSKRASRLLNPPGY